MVRLWLPLCSQLQVSKMISSLGTMGPTFTTATSSSSLQASAPLLTTTTPTPDLYQVGFKKQCPDPGILLNPDPDLNLDKVFFEEKPNSFRVFISVADPDSNPDPHVFGPPGSGSMIKGMDPDPSIIMQK
jgi:hypothetical protein